ncbi:sodium:solute symporter family protein [Bacillus seohaeanensis]|uniref:Sodium:solute symporter family protein n=1 Tax=Bacillus seohaeanensis TaxID=284580 RepID=A0ABW5RW88_9BACI
MNFNGVFLLYCIIFIAVLVSVGFITRKWITGSNDYFIAGREIGMLTNIFGVAAIGFAGTMITLIPSLAITSGIWGALGFGLVYSIGGLALYGGIFAKYIRRSGAHTLSEWLEMRFDSRTRTLITIASMLGLLGIMANNVVSMAIVTTGFTGWSLIGTLSVIFFMFLLFTYIGGFWAVTLTDFIQVCIGMIALPVLLITIISKYGGTNFINQNWPGDLGYWTSGQADGSLAVFSLQYPSVLTFSVLFACFLVWGNNYYWLRVSSTRSERTAKVSYVLGALFLLVPGTILAFIGVYASSIFPDFFAPYGEGDPTSAFGVVLQAVPIGVAALALLGALAASISTSTTALMGASSTAVRDLYQRYVKPNATSKELTVPSKVITLILGLLVWLLCFYPGGPLYLFAFSTAWLGPPSVLVFLGVWWKRTTFQGAFYGGILGIIVLVVFTLMDLFGIFSIAAYTHVGVVGLVVTVLATVLISLVTKPNYYAKKNWNDVDFDKQATVCEQEKVVLTYIHLGYNTMAEISDLLGVDSSVSNKIVESLDKKRLIKRESYTGSGFYTFTITESGSRFVEIKQREVPLAQDGISVDDLYFLKQLEKGQDALNIYLKENDFDSLKASVILAKLIRQKYLKESGFIRRKVAITQSGRDVYQKHKSVV